MTDCEIRTYQNVSKYKIDYLRSQLADGGATITGNNPWNVNTHRSAPFSTTNVLLRASWNEGEQVLTVEITDKPNIASCNRVWSEIESQIQTVLAMKDPEVTRPAPTPVGKADVIYVLDRPTLNRAVLAATAKNAEDGESQKKAVVLMALAVAGGLGYLMYKKAKGRDGLVPV
jgi:hypothetical protein